MIIKFQQSKALTSHLEGFWSIVHTVKCKVQSIRIQESFYFSNVKVFELRNLPSMTSFPSLLCNQLHQLSHWVETIKQQNLGRFRVINNVFHNLFCQKKVWKKISVISILCIASKIHMLKSYFISLLVILLNDL